MKRLLTISFLSLGLLIGCSSEMTFEEQIIHDLSTKLPSGTCYGYPEGTIVSNIKIGEIVDPELDGMIIVPYSLTYEINGIKKDTTTSMLYAKYGSKYKLTVMGCNSDLIRPRRKFKDTSVQRIWYW